MTKTANACSEIPSRDCQGKVSPENKENEGIKSGDKLKNLKYVNYLSNTMNVDGTSSSRKREV